eukprot:5169208-Amphidinium_carterae.1
MSSMLGLASELALGLVCVCIPDSTAHAQRRCELFAFSTEAEALFHEGTIPESASRLTMADITISFGHGLRGLLPSISGTVGLLSLWENRLA